VSAEDREMTYLGRQIMAELFECDPKPLRDLGTVRKIMERAARAANSNVVQSAFHKFGNMGVSGVLVIAESHLSIHTWPEYGYAAVDVFTCGEHTKPEEALKVLIKGFRAKRVVSKLYPRGSKDELEIMESVLPNAGV
jgi:S-adenosylmethionine decarboxylase